MLIEVVIIKDYDVMSKSFYLGFNILFQIKFNLVLLKTSIEVITLQVFISSYNFKFQAVITGSQYKLFISMKLSPPFSYVLPK